MDFANPLTQAREVIATGRNASISVHTIQTRYLVMAALGDAGYTDVHSELKDLSSWGHATWIVTGTAPREEPEPAPCKSASIEWLNTRRGLIGVTEVRTAMPAGPDIVSWVWVTSDGDTGRVDNASGRPYAVAEAYTAMVQRSAPPVASFPWEQN